MSIKNRDTKEDIRIGVGPWPTKEHAFDELRRHGYRRRPEMNDLPIKFEKEYYPAFTVASSETAPGFMIVEYPSDAEIYRELPDRIENPEKMGSRDDFTPGGVCGPEGTLVDLDKDKK